jgi:hypothetical protein
MMALRSALAFLISASAVFSETCADLTFVLFELKSAGVIARTFALEGLTASIGSVGDAYDNAAAKTVMGLFKNEAIGKDSPSRTGPLKGLPDVEEIVFDWVS